MCSITISSPLHAKDRIKLFAEAGTFINLNTGDIKGDAGSRMLSQKSTFGGGFGLGVKVYAPKNIFLQLSMGLRFSPQRLNINATGLNVSQKFTNSDYYLRLLLGYSFPVAKDTRISFGIGFQNYYSLNHRVQEDQLHIRQYNNIATGETENYVANIYAIHWGDSRTTESRTAVPFIFNPLLHLGVVNKSILPRGRELALGLEYSTRMGSDNGLENSNTGYIHLLDPDRNILASEKFEDQYKTINLVLSIGLF